MDWWRLFHKPIISSEATKTEDINRMVKWADKRIKNGEDAEKVMKKARKKFGYPVAFCPLLDPPYFVVPLGMSEEEIVQRLL